MLFLDEPTTGMDPQARHATWEIIRAIRERGATVLLTTHFMDEAERLADRIGIIDHGQLVALDTPAALSRIGSNNAVRFTAAPGLDHAALAGLPAASVVREEPAGTYTVETTDAPALLVELTTWLRDNGVELRDLRVGFGSLEEVFLRLTGREVRE
jgi:ABC-2 type transport system ATP-binding protein